MPAAKGREIRERRQRLGMKLGELAEKAGVKYQTLANAESLDRYPLSIEFAWRIAHALADKANEPVVAADLVEMDAA